MKRKVASFVLLGIFLLIPFIRICNAQDSYVGIKNGDEYEWTLSVYTENWKAYMEDDLGAILENLIPLGDSNLNFVYYDWRTLEPPQSNWQLTVNDIGVEQIGPFYPPYDNTTVTSTPIYGKLKWEITPDYTDEWDQTWHIVNDTSSFLRQSFNLNRWFSPYAAMFRVLFAPISIDWSIFVNEIPAVMSSRGGLYKNISATAQSNGFLIYVPPLGFENNSAAINIKVNYNSKGVLSNYEFLYGGLKLVKFIAGDYIPENERIPNQYIFILIGLTVILFVEIIMYIYKQKGR
ncbi:MAG: hypothetical protein ACFFCE_16090 [Promethearchaeota archaeon]